MPIIDESKLNEYADAVFNRCNYFNDYTLETIGRRIKATGQLSAHDQIALKNMADISGDMRSITKKLAEVTGQNIADIEKIYTQTMTDGVNSYKPMFDYKGMKFLPFEQNEFARQLVRHWATETAGKMINLSRTKALCFDKYNLVGELIGNTPLEGAFQKAIDDAVIAVSTGTTDFNTAMRKTVENLGGSGVRVNYGGGVTRSLSGMARANLLYGAKQSAQAYDRHVGEELGCDGFEVDYHSNPRPSHEFMGGKMYSYNGEVTIDGKTYEDGAAALARLGDYGCLHFKIDVILGVSEPRYDSEWLDEQKQKDKELIEYNGIKKTGYGWKQTQRRLECATRQQRDIAYMAKASGNNALVRNAGERIEIYRKAYDEMCDTVGLEKRYNRMATYYPKSVDKAVESGIIKLPIKSDEEHYKKLIEGLSKENVDYNPISVHSSPPLEQTIIQALSGGDKTQGSCASLGLTYIGQKQGWNVLDFRDGESRKFFANYPHLIELFNMPGIKTLRANGGSYVTVGNHLLKQCEVGKEYYLCVGKHAAIVRKQEGGILQYLELQSATNSGWQDFAKSARETLSNRFGCSSASSPGASYWSFMVDINDSNFNTDEFKSILGYINTSKDMQMKGVSGFVK